MQPRTGSGRQRRGPGSDAASNAARQGRPGSPGLPAGSSFSPAYHRSRLSARTAVTPNSAPAAEGRPRQPGFCVLLFSL